ncbi:MAG: hypothetical protein R3326_05745 [Gemmatimonadota bacterium]|nr:hypothetical protein [Gemmatimonadota bacterium]
MNGRATGGSPRGLCLAVLGPDGAGKSTVIDRVTRHLGPRFAGVRRFHLRPHFGRDTSRGPVTDPHADRPRSAIASAMKLVLWWIDYRIGYARWVRPALRRGELVVFDRYFWDLLADPRRYRYAGSSDLVRSVGRGIPRPDVTVVLDAPVEVLRSRKREVPREEVASQREIYRALAEELDGAVRVDASPPADQVAEAVIRTLEGAALGDPIANGGDR